MRESRKRILCQHMLTSIWKSNRSSNLIPRLYIIFWQLYRFLWSWSWSFPPKCKILSIFSVTRHSDHSIGHYRFCFCILSHIWKSGTCSNLVFVCCFYWWSIIISQTNKVACLRFLNDKQICSDCAVQKKSIAINILVLTLSISYCWFVKKIWEITFYLESHRNNKRKIIRKLYQRGWRNAIGLKIYITFFRN